MTTRRVLTRGSRSSATTCARSRLDHRQPLRLRRRSLHGLDDRTVHSVGDLVRELDRDPLEAGRVQPGLVLALGERTGDAADVATAVPPIFGTQAVLRDD